MFMYKYIYCHVFVSLPIVQDEESKTGNLPEIDGYRNFKEPGEQKIYKKNIFKNIFKNLQILIFSEKTNLSTYVANLVF